MGYYTHFKLMWSPQAPVEDKPNCDCKAPKGKFCAECGEPSGFKNLDERVKEALKDMEIDGCLTGESCKWYEHESDLSKLSLRFPNVIFHLEGSGENLSDIWDAFALSGKVKRTKAQIIRASVPKEWSRQAECAICSGLHETKDCLKVAYEEGK